MQRVFGRDWPNSGGVGGYLPCLPRLHSPGREPDTRRPLPVSRMDS